VTRPESSDIKVGPIQLNVQTDQTAAPGDAVTSGGWQHIGIFAVIGALVGLPPELIERGLEGGVELDVVEREPDEADRDHEERVEEAAGQDEAGEGREDEERVTVGRSEQMRDQARGRVLAEDAVDHERERPRMGEADEDGQRGQDDRDQSEAPIRSEVGEEPRYGLPECPGALAAPDHRPAPCRCM